MVSVFPAGQLVSTLSCSLLVTQHPTDAPGTGEHFNMLPALDILEGHAGLCLWGTWGCSLMRASGLDWTSSAPSASSCLGSAPSRVNRVTVSR